MVKGRDQGGGLPDVFAGRQGTSKKYGKRVVCDARETAKQYERFQASLKPDIPVKKPHNPNRFDLILFLQRCCSNEELPELPADAGDTTRVTSFDVGTRYPGTGPEEDVQVLARSR